MSEGEAFEGPADGADEDPWAERPSSSDGSDGWASQFGQFSQFDDPYDDFFEDEPTAPYPLPPDDRLWRHPSEIAYLEGSQAAAPTARPTATSTGWKTLAVVGLAAGILGAALSAGVFAVVLDNDPQVIERVVERQAVQTAFTGSGSADALASGVKVADIAEQVTPSVVRVEVYVAGQSVGSGSGVIFRDDGHVMTNAHVVDGGEAWRVVMADGQFLDAELVGSDTLTDIAVVRIIEPGSMPFTPAALGSTEPLRAGDPAIAIGSPLRLAGGPTVTVGVVSAVNRRLQSPNGDWLYDLVQTDAPISPGSSGGALVDSSGALVGITTVIAVSEVGAEGLGFATPVEIAHEVATDIINWGGARHGLLGIRGEDATSDVLAPTGRLTGVVVRQVDGPAAAAGLQIDDVILSLDGRPVGGMADLVVDARLLDPGSETLLEVARGGQVLVVTVVVGQLN